MSRLDKYIAEVSSFVKELCPDAKIEVSLDTYEKEDADLTVYVPEEKSDEIHEAVVGLTTDILVEEGYHIVVFMRDLEDYPEKQAMAV